MFFLLLLPGSKQNLPQGDQKYKDNRVGDEAFPCSSSGVMTVPASCPGSLRVCCYLSSLSDVMPSASS
jgi:hypothetical protein